MKNPSFVAVAAVTVAALACLAGCDNTKTTATPPKSPATLTHAELPPPGVNPNATPAGVTPR